MSESEQQWNDSPLQSGRGSTTISDAVVSQITGMAAREVEGVHMGGSASRTTGGLLEGITGSESQTRGVSVEVGRTETAIDLKMGIEYGRNILQTVEEVRRRITDRIQTITGLKVTEMNVTISDITFPEKEERRRIGSGDGSGGQASESQDYANAGPETRTMPARDLRPGASERETTQVEPRSRTCTEGASGPVPEEEVRVEGSPLEGDETAELRPGDTETQETRTSEEAETAGETETSAETETSEETETEAEARRRRRAEERARRRRRSEDS